MEPFEFYQDVNNYIRINNKIYRRFHHDPDKLNPVPVEERLMRQAFFIRQPEIDAIPTLEGWINEPQHGDDYQQIVNNRWNTYYRVRHTPKEGQWPTIEKLIRHLYGANGVEPDQTEWLYDYHTLLLRQPKQKLFARVLYSHVQGTSKSTLATLEQMMFKDNLVQIRDHEFESQFNSLWSDALIIHMDEPAFQRKQLMSRQIRDLVTKDKVAVRRMREEAVTSSFYGKFLITSNDSDFMPFEFTDRRYWIREVPRFPEEDLDPLFVDKMKEELDHYIHFLLTRQMRAERPEGMFWLPQDVCLTNGFKKLVGDNITREHDQLQDYFEQYFMRDRKRDHVTFTLKDLKSTIKWEGSEPSSQELGKILRDKLGLEQPTKPRRLNKGENYLDPQSDAVYGAGRFWTVKAENFDLSIDIFGNIGL